MTSPAELIAHKRDGKAFSRSQIQEIVSGVTRETLTDAQLGALLMALFLRGMDAEETAALTLAMRDSGTVLDLSDLGLADRGYPARPVDKHSTGGVGDKVSLFLAPLVAAAGVPVPMISGRGLGHTGGTLDKLHSIPGYRTDLSIDEFRAVLADCGFAMAGASADIAPADARMYATRDVTGTVESVPLITASILAKKLAEGIEGLVLDVKCGRAAFMKSRAEADALTESLVAVGRAAGKEVVALITDMDTPLGCAVGNALEVVEVVECLHGRGPSDLCELTFALGAEMLVMAGAAPDVAAATDRLRSLVADGSALAKCRENVERQGGDPTFLEDPAVLGRARVVVECESPHDGERFVEDIDPLEVGLAAMDLGAGRRVATDDVDPHVGVVLHRQVGQTILGGEMLFEVHAQSAAAAEVALQRVLGAIRFVDHPVRRRQLILDRRS